MSDALDLTQVPLIESTFHHGDTECQPAAHELIRGLLDDPLPPQNRFIGFKGGHKATQGQGKRLRNES